MIVCDLFNFLNISNIAANKDPLAYEIFFSLVNSHCKFFIKTDILILHPQLSYLIINLPRILKKIIFSGFIYLG